MEHQYGGKHRNEMNHSSHRPHNSKYACTMEGIRIVCSAIGIIWALFSCAMDALAEYNSPKPSIIQSVVLVVLLEFLHRLVWRCVQCIISVVVLILLNWSLYKAIYTHRVLGIYVWRLGFLYICTWVMSCYWMFSWYSVCDTLKIWTLFLVTRGFNRVAISLGQHDSFVFSNGTLEEKTSSGRVEDRAQPTPSTSTRVYLSPACSILYIL